MCLCLLFLKKLPLIFNFICREKKDEGRIETSCLLKCFRSTNTTFVKQVKKKEYHEILLSAKLLFTRTSVSCDNDYCLIFIHG